MKHTKEQIAIIAKNILKKTKFTFDEKESFLINKIDNYIFNKEEFNAWKISLFFGEEDWGRNQIASLIINDENGRPIFLQHSLNSFIYYDVDADGNIIAVPRQGSK